MEPRFWKSEKAERRIKILQKAPSFYSSHTVEMLSWVKSFFFKPAVAEPDAPSQKIVVLPRGRHTLSPYRLLDWYSQQVDRQLDPLPPFPKTEPPVMPSPEHNKG